MVIVTTSDNDYQMARSIFNKARHDVWLIEAKPQELLGALDLRGIKKDAKILLFGRSNRQIKKAFEFLKAGYPDAFFLKLADAYHLGAVI